MLNNLVQVPRSYTSEECRANLRWSKSGKLQQLWRVTKYQADTFLEDIYHTADVIEEWRDVPLE